MSQVDLSEIYQKPGLMTRLAYGVGGAAGGIKNNGFDYVLLLFYSQVLGLSAVLVAAALWIALVVDAVSDPIIGYWSDNARTKFGRRHPFMYVAMVPIAIAYFFVWNPPEALEGMSLFGWLLTFTIATRLMYTLYEVPSFALAAELSQDYDSRTSLMSFRYFFAWIAGLGIQVTLFLYLVRPTEIDPSGTSYIPAWHQYGAIGACLIFIAIAITTLGTHGHISKLKSAPPQRKLTPIKVLKEIGETVSNPSFRALFIATLFGLLASGISATLNQFINIFFWGFTNTQIMLITLGIFGSALMALVIAPLAGKRLGKKKAAIIIGLMAFTLAPAPVFARLLGLLPPNGTSELFYIVLFISVIDVALIIAYQMLTASMVTDIVEQSELQTGRRSEGVFFAGISFIRKLAQGIGVLSASAILAFASIIPGMKTSEVGVDSVAALGLGYAVTLLTVWMLMILSLTFYRISRADHEQNLRDLADSKLS